MEKKLISRKIIAFNEDGLEGSIEDVEKYIKQFRKSCERDGWSKIEIYKYQDYDYSQMEAMGLRKETDEELNRRIYKAEIKKKTSALAKEKRKNKYLELKKEFES